MLCLLLLNLLFLGLGLFLGSLFLLGRLFLAGLFLASFFLGCLLLWLFLGLLLWLFLGLFLLWLLLLHDLLLLLLLWCSLDLDDLVLATVLGESSFGNTALEGGVDEAPGGFLGTEGFLDGLEG